MPYAPIEDGTLYYEEHGSGPPLMIVSGLVGNTQYWRPQIEPFAKHFRVILHDHRGCGRSTRSEIRYSIDQMSRDALALMDHLGLERAHVLGHSTGGAVGQTIAVTAPERVSSLILYATFAWADEFVRRIIESRKTLLERSGPDAFIRISPLYLFPPWWIRRFPEKVAALDQVSKENFSGVAITASRCQAIIDYNRLADVERIRTPTMVLCAQDDFLTPPYLSEELAQRIPGAKLVMLERGAHAVSQVEPEVFNQAVLGFLESVK